MFSLHKVKKSVVHRRGGLHIENHFCEINAPDCLSDYKNDNISYVLIP